MSYTMWRMFRIHKSYQLIHMSCLYMRSTRTLLLLIVILSTCFFGIIVVSLYKNERMRDVMKSDRVFNIEKDSFARLVGTIREYNEVRPKKIKTANYLNVDDIPLLTLFTSWVDRKDKYIVQNRTVENWVSLKPHIQPVIFTNNSQLGSQCRQRRWNVLPLQHAAVDGVPVVKYMYLDAMHHFNSVFYGFSNSDILFDDGLIKTLITVRAFIKASRVPVLITGRRINVDYKLPCNASDWGNITSLSKKGELVKPDSADYFITTKYYPWEEMDEIIIGRIRIDNWIIQFSQMKNVTVIDATSTILALHQTTETGNSESAMQRDKFYNDNIVRTVRHMTINLNQGQTDCAHFITDFTRSKLVQLVRQTQHMKCKSDTSSMTPNRILHVLLIQWLLCYFLLVINK